MSELGGQTQDEISLKATEINLVAFFPRANELMLDLDEPYESAVIKWNLHPDVPVVKAMAKEKIRIVSRLFTKSKSGNAHLYIRLSRSLETQERIILQACLRSDPVRDFLSLCRFWKANETDKYYCVALFETQEAAEEVKKWRW